MLKSILISFFSLLLFFTANAQDNDRSYDDSTVKFSPPDIVSDQEYDQRSDDTLFIDTALYFSPLRLSADTVAQWKNAKEFAYIKNLDSLLLAEKNKKEKKQERDDNGGSNWLGDFLSSEGVKFFFWALAIFFVLFILYKLFLSEGAFRRNTKSAGPGMPEVEEETITSESNFEQMIRQALQSGNYRLAVRYNYLRSLYKLADRKMVELAADKTNHQYVREIRSFDLQNAFSALTRNYEYVWYGEFEIDEQIYRRIESSFSQFNSKL